jgi:hypothetical protein
MLPFCVNLAFRSECHSVPPPSSLRSLCALCVSALDFSSALSASRLASHQISAVSVFSFTYKLPIFYPLCFDIHPCNGGVYPPPALRTFRRADVQTFRRSISFVFIFFRTLLRNGSNSTPLQSTSSTLFPSPWGVYPLGAPFSRMAFCSVRIGRFAFPGQP